MPKAKGERPADAERLCMLSSACARQTRGDVLERGSEDLEGALGAALPDLTMLLCEELRDLRERSVAPRVHQDLLTENVRFRSGSRASSLHQRILCAGRGGA